MSRSVDPIAACVLLGLAACTRLNPAFDGGDDEFGEGESESADTTTADTEADADVGTSDTADTEADTTTDTTDGPLGDLPVEEICEGSLGFPLPLKFTSPENWQGTCPEELVVQGFLEFIDGQFALRSCEGDGGCSNDCQVVHPLDAAEFDFEPMLGQCVVVEVAKTLAVDPALCTYASLSVFPKSDLASPYFLGTTASASPTPLAVAILDGWPQLHGEMGTPTPEVVCSCRSLGVESSCCVEDVDDVALYSYLLGGGVGIAQIGTHADYVLAGSQFEYSFYNAMAQRVGNCSEGIETSWKLFATAGF
jgi:hypothetical protein